MIINIQFVTKHVNQKLKLLESS